MSLFSDLNRKPYNYIKPAHAFQAMEKETAEDGEFSITKNAITFNDFWFNPAKPHLDIPETVTVKLVTPVVQKGEVFDENGNDVGFDPNQHEAQCMSMPAYMTRSFHSIASDEKLSRAVAKGVQIKLQEYEDKRGETQIGVVFI